MDFTYPVNFDKLRPELQLDLVEEMRKKIVDSICVHTEQVVRDAIPKALEARTGLAYKSELISSDPHPLWAAQSKLVTHQVRFILGDTPPQGWQYLGYEQLKELWERHCAQPQKA